MSTDKDKSSPHHEGPPQDTPAQRESPVPKSSPRAPEEPISEDLAAHQGAQPDAPNFDQGAAEPSAAAGAAEFAPPQPASPGDLFVVGRWKELAAADSAWFTRTTDVGHRQRLAELIVLAKANGTGGVRSESISELLVETKDSFAHEDLFVSARFPELAAEIKELSTSGSSFVPGSAALASATACLGRLEGAQYVDSIADALVARAAGAERNLASLRPLGKLVELLDSELSFGGHSRTWRAGVVEDVARRVAAGETLADALPQTFAAHHANITREFVVMVPVWAAPGGEDNDESAASQLVDRQRHRQRDSAGLARRGTTGRPTPDR